MLKLFPSTVPRHRTTNLDARRCRLYTHILSYSSDMRSPRPYFLSAAILDLTPDQVCVVLNNKGVRVCTVCKSPYKASVRLPGGESISLFQSPLPPPYICFMVVTRHQNNEVRHRFFARSLFSLFPNSFVCAPPLDFSNRVPEYPLLSPLLPLQVFEPLLSFYRSKYLNLFSPLLSYHSDSIIIRRCCCARVG